MQAWMQTALHVPALAVKLQNCESKNYACKHVTCVGNEMEDSKLLSKSSSCKKKGTRSTSHSIEYKTSENETNKGDNWFKDW